MPLEFVILALCGILIFFALVACALATWLLVKLAALSGLSQEVEDLSEKLSSFRAREARRGDGSVTKKRGAAREGATSLENEPAVSTTDDVAARKAQIERTLNVRA